MKNNKKPLFTMKVKKGEVGEWQRIAREEGHNSAAGFIKWLIHNYKSGKLKLK